LAKVGNLRLVFFSRIQNEELAYFCGHG
jgi:hypothetical protein